MPHSTSSLTHHLARHLEGPVLDAFARDDVTDIHANDDGRVRFHTRRGVEVTDLILAPETIRSVLQLLASEQGDSLIPGRAFFAGRFPSDVPFHQARIHAVLPPVVTRPVFAIRVHAPQVFTLEDFATREQRLLIVTRILATSKNVLVIGGTSTGKTSLLNSLLQVVAELFPEERLLCLEDVPEITVAMDDHLCLRTESTGYSLQDLVANSLRLNPSRLVVGEVRGGEALDLIDAWSTGHRGGFATLHAEGAHGALMRLERLARRHPRAGNASLRPDIAGAVDIVIELRRLAGRPRITAIHRLARLTRAGLYVIQPVTTSGEL